MIIVINFFEDIKKWRIGFAAIMYYELMLKCEVMKGKDKRFWVKMPVEKTRHRNVNIASWPNKKISDEFQKSCLQQLEERFQISRFK